MKKRILLLVFTCTFLMAFSQKPQKIGYIDMEYILENVPEYTSAQSKLDNKINGWNGKLDKLKTEISNLETALHNEKALLTNDLIKEREEDIEIKRTELKEKQENYFGTSGELFLLRKQIVKPVQDQIYNAVQEIAKNKKYDMILDKSDELIMLYSNSRFDVSELVLNSIVKDRRKVDNLKKKGERVIAQEKKKEEIKTKIEERKTKQELLKEKVKKANEARAKQREGAKKARDAARLKKLDEVKKRREAAQNKKKEGLNKTTPKEKISKDKKVVEDEVTKQPILDKKVENVKTEVPKTKAQIREEKRKLLLARIQSQKKKKDSLKKVATDKRAAKLKQIEENKKKLENK